MFCSQCGKQIPDGSSFCQFCGCKLQGTSPVQNTMNAPGRPAGMGSTADALTDRQRYTEVAQNKKKANLKIWIPISLLIILILLIAVSVFIFIKRDRSSEVLGISDDDLSEVVTIPDSVLKKAIQDDLGIGDREITKADALLLTRLEYSGNDSDQKIKDITGLSEFKNLTDLDLTENQISDIGALSGLTNLTDLGLAANQISDISALSELTNLEGLCLKDNPVLENKSREEIMDVLSGAENLTYVDF